MRVPQVIYVITALTIAYNLRIVLSTETVSSINPISLDERYRFAMKSPVAFCLSFLRFPRSLLMALVLVLCLQVVQAVNFGNLKWQP